MKPSSFVYGLLIMGAMILGSVAGTAYVKDDPTYLFWLIMGPVAMTMVLALIDSGLRSWNRAIPSPVFFAIPGAYFTADLVTLLLRLARP